jgi:hypothetical protein
MQSFGDPFLRLFGVKMRHFINVAQALQQFCTVTVLIFSKALNIEQIAHSKVCFIAMMAVISEYIHREDLPLRKSWTHC